MFRFLFHQQRIWLKNRETLGVAFDYAG